MLWNLGQHNSHKYQHTSNQLSGRQLLSQNQPACKQGENRLQTENQRCHRGVYIFLSYNLKGIGYTAGENTGIKNRRIPEIIPAVKN